jgi:DNA-binding response OmpR family regulator
MKNMQTEGSALDLHCARKETKSFSILVVDDEEYILAFVGIKLRVSGYQVSTASNGIQALEILRNKVPDLVILDLIMPRMDGVKLLKEIRKFSSVPVIILSAVYAQDVKIRGLREGADDYIHKPFDPDELVARIEAIRRRQEKSDSTPESQT